MSTLRTMLLAGILTLHLCSIPTVSSSLAAKFKTPATAQEKDSSMTGGDPDSEQPTQGMKINETQVLLQQHYEAAASAPPVAVVVVKYLISGTIFAQIPIPGRNGDFLQQSKPYTVRQLLNADQFRLEIENNSKPSKSDSKIRRAFRLFDETGSRKLGLDSEIDFKERETATDTFPATGGMQDVVVPSATRWYATIGIVDVSLDVLDPESWWAHGTENMPFSNHLAAIKSNLHLYLNNDGTIRQKGTLPDGSFPFGSFFAQVHDWVQHARANNKGFFYGYQFYNAAEGPGLPGHRMLFSADAAALLQFQAEAANARGLQTPHQQGRSAWSIDVGDPYFWTRSPERYFYDTLWVSYKDEEKQKTERGEIEPDHIEQADKRTSSYWIRSASAAPVLHDVPFGQVQYPMRKMPDFSKDRVKDDLHLEFFVPSATAEAEWKTVSVLSKGVNIATYTFQRSPRPRGAFQLRNAALRGANVDDSTFAWKCTRISINLSNGGRYTHVFSVSQPLGGS
ncbi:unnamed protein product [Amoebophrya sp. A120]|nr:unnamed protein product [Amoebophrya sp. A120]|eukprot:GSA120T00002726001.1